jgi:hypothetical protein
MICARAPGPSAHRAQSGSGRRSGVVSEARRERLAALVVAAVEAAAELKDVIAGALP